MALLFTDGFDHYATADINKKWTTIVGAPAITAGGGRRGSASLTVNSSNEGVTRTFDTAFSAWVVGFAFSTTALSVSEIAYVLDAGSIQMNLALNADGTLSLRRNGATLTGGTSAQALSINTWYYIEVKLTIADSVAADSCKVRVNGVDWITIAAGQDTKNTTNAAANQFRLLTSANITFNFDDLYICDQSGTTNNNFLGDCRVDTAFADADGTYSQFTPSTGTTHYTLVDEAAPNTTDYNAGANVGDRDSYGFAALPALTSQVVYGVQVNAAILKDDAGARSASTMVRSGTTNADGASVALGTTQTYLSQIYETDPSGGGAWTESAINAAEFGTKVTA